VRLVTVFLLAVAVVAGSTPPDPSPKVLTVEPIVLGAVGLVGVGLGAWRLGVSGEELARLERLVAQVKEVSPEMRLDPTYRLQKLEEGRLHHQRGTVEAFLGWSLVGVGGAFLAGAVVWLLVEGVTRPPLVVTPAFMPDGGALVMQGRF
jgi:hypothetical protein